MKKLALLALAALGLTGCWTSIFTVAHTVEPVAPPKTVYTTTVTTPSPKTTTVTTFTVTSYNTDPCFYLDLNAVAAAFAESRSVREFEQLLNSSRYMINNLDLNHDGWVDYLRVIETHRGYYHTLLIQACLAPSVYQDVATLIAERRADALYVEVVGDRYLYGYNYIVRPVFVKRPPMWDVYGHPSYSPWSSPYHYGYLPSYYTKPQPIYLNHYQAYVTTYMSNHHYCHHCDYPTTVFYSGYTTMTQSNSRHDYATQHPNESFEKRVTVTPSSTGGVSVRNAGQLRSEVAKASAKSETKTETKTETKPAASTTVSSRSGSTSSTSSSTSASTSGSTSSRSGSTATTTTTTATSTKTGTSARGTATTPAPSRVPSTTVESRVNKSGTTRTTVKTTDASGRTSTVKRESTSTRSSSTSTRSGSSTSTSTRSGGSSDGSATKSSRGSSSESNPRSSRRGR